MRKSKLVLKATYLVNFVRLLAMFLGPINHPPPGLGRFEELVQERDDIEDADQNWSRSHRFIGASPFLGSLSLQPVMVRIKSPATGLDCKYTNL